MRENATLLGREATGFAHQYGINRGVGARGVEWVGGGDREEDPAITRGRTTIESCKEDGDLVEVANDLRFSEANSLHART